MLNYNNVKKDTIIEVGTILDIGDTGDTGDTNNIADIDETGENSDVKDELITRLTQ
ncbi:22803_t:CDS:2 [Gigaspora margarita]|uniref:22803_t:CDS:1 n=1 Tax=Gigaspora margarita TaxID=4874 RepID=A0ABN7UZM4_GIGMA|nr:22803_t:CDS:2 [Gigaspora margarita]